MAAEIYIGKLQSYYQIDYCHYRANVNMQKNSFSYLQYSYNWKVSTVKLMQKPLADQTYNT